MTLEVLAVDDSRTMRDMIRVALEPRGFTVHTADDGLHGIDVLGGIIPDAIITDINMPRLDGFGFIQAVRDQEMHRATPILVLTTEAAASAAELHSDNGATLRLRAMPYSMDA